MGLQQDVGRQVRRHRERMGLSQVDLAEAIGRSVQMVGRIERGRSAPSFETLEALSKVLAVPTAAFFPSDIPVAASSDPARARLAARLAPLSPDEIAWLDRIVAGALRDRPHG